METQTNLNRSNLEYVESLYQQFLTDPSSVEPQWRYFFEGVDFATDRGGVGAGAVGGGLNGKELDVYNLIQAFRDYGHFEANLNPLAPGLKSFPELSLEKFNLSDADMDQEFQVAKLIGRPGAAGPMKLREIVSHLRDSYCKTISVQVHDAMPTIRNWFIREMEQSQFQLTVDERKLIFAKLARTEAFENFINTRYVGKKRFSIEGGDAMIPMMEALVHRGTALGVEEIVVGMAHRGRLNVLANFMGKNVDSIFAEFDGIRTEDNSFFDGDVKYHLGFSSDRKTPNGNCHLSLAFNPSHLEAVNPVVLGMTRAKQRIRRDTQERRKVIPLLIHGNGAMIGQGVVAETFTMSQLRGYTVGGTIHICVDNQVAFTTSPENERSSPYSSDIAKILQTPVIHVNGDDPEACYRAMDIALRFRQEFKRDVVINMLCYRRFGHNEGDEPAFTQPLMYDKIKKHPTVFKQYGTKLEAEGVVPADSTSTTHKAYIEEFQVGLDTIRKTPPDMKPDALKGLWKGLRRATPDDLKKPVDTRVPLKTLKDLASVLTTLPDGFTAHPKILKVLEERSKMIETGHINWGMAELLSYGSLLKEGTSVRLSGQDCVRGTFTHRHAGFNDIKTDARFMPLTTVNPEEVEFCVYESPLSEYAVMGFEYGNSSTDPTFLTLWEAQFGDFVNGAQIILDQFLSSAEEKWQRMSGLVLLLPHGYEGQGPEHSSARLERFLQLCAQNNMQVCNMTTPAQLFHVLRRQIKRDFRKPLVIMSPKSLLRHPRVVSTVDELAGGTFQEVLIDTQAVIGKTETVILCSGKLYYELLEQKEKLEPAQADKFAILRVEQLYPFPQQHLAPALKAFSKLKRIVWAQEEPKNMGAWTFMQPRLFDLTQELGLNVPVLYIGRTERASTATGSEKVHQYEQAEIVQSAFGMKK